MGEKYGGMEAVVSMMSSKSLRNRSRNTCYLRLQVSVRAGKEVTQAVMNEHGIDIFIRVDLI